MRRPVFVVFRIIWGIFGVASALFGILILGPPHPDYVFGPFWFALGVALFILPTIYVRALVRRGMRASVKRTAESREAIVISDGGIDVQGVHSSSHYDWAALGPSKRVPQGILVQLGVVSVFVSAREFDTESDFERALALFRTGLGAKFTG